jgi:ABC-type sugar transport system permease subunit
MPYPSPLLAVRQPLCRIGVKVLSLPRLPGTVGCRSVSVRVAVSLLLVAVYFAACLWFAERNIGMLKRADPLSWEAVYLTLSFAVHVTVSTMVLLVALAVVLEAPCSCGNR